jgi:hypothetical protein
MQNSKLLEVLRTFSGHEWKSFKAFVDSPYFNRNPDVAALCRWLADQCGSGGEVHRESGFHALFPDQPFDDARWNHLMSFLLKLAEQFLGLEQYVKESFAPRFFILQALAERGLEKHYRYIFDQTRKKQAVAPYQDAAYFLQRYQLENYEANLLSRSAIRRFNESAQISTDNLDQFYLAEKLRYTCFMLTSQVLLATPYNFQLVEEVSRFVAGITDAAPVVQAYYRIYKLLSEDIATDHFDALRRLLAEQEQMFDRQVLAELYQYAINYCNLQIMKNREPYVAEALDLYQTGIQSGILLENGNLSPWHFKNIIKLGLRLKRYAWTEQFILDHNRLLEPEFREDAVYYNLAELLLLHRTLRRGVGAAEQGGIYRRPLQPWCKGHSGKNILRNRRNRCTGQPPACLQDIPAPQQGNLRRSSEAIPSLYRITASDPAQHAGCGTRPA